MLRKKRTYTLLLLLLFISYGIHYLLNSDKESKTLANSTQTIESSAFAQIKTSHLLYIIKQNDTWKSLSDSFKLCASEICILNSIKQELDLKEGDTVEIPVHLSADSILNPEHYSEITYTLDENGFCEMHRLPPKKTTNPITLKENKSNNTNGDYARKPSTKTILKDKHPRRARNVKITSYSDTEKENKKDLPIEIKKKEKTKFGL